jgi:ketosteroid isomerase-like protein
MSEENVEAVRAAYAAFADEGVEAALDFFTEDTVLYSIPEWPDDPEYRGHDGLRRLDRQWDENFDEFGFEVLELRDAGEAVVSLAEISGRMKGSGTPMTMQIGVVFSGFEDGRIAEQRLHSTWQSALKAAGLAESEENVEVVQRAVEAFNQGGMGSKTTLSFFDPTAVFEEPPEQLGPRVARGREEVSRLFTQFDAAWEEHRTRPDEIRAIDDERVLMLSRDHFRGRDGIEIEQTSGTIFTLRGGKIVRMQAFWDRENALEAAELRE